MPAKHPWLNVCGQQPFNVSSAKNRPMFNVLCQLVIVLVSGLPLKLATRRRQVWIKLSRSLPVRSSSGSFSQKQDKHGETFLIEDEMLALHHHAAKGRCLPEPEKPDPAGGGERRVFGERSQNHDELGREERNMESVSAWLERARERDTGLLTSPNEWLASQERIVSRVWWTQFKAH